MLLLSAVLSCALGTNAQQFNVGVMAGPTTTVWRHPSSELNYTWELQQYNIKPSYGFLKDNINEKTILCYFGGIALEYLWNSNLSIGLDALYAHRATGLYFSDERFPIGISQYATKEHTLVADYQTAELLIPLTYYMSLGRINHIQPFIYAGPKLSYILSGTMTYSSTVRRADSGPTTTSVETSFGPNTFNLFNIGATIGVGTQYRIETGNYCTLLKLDLSANFNTLETFTEADLANEFNYKRYSADAELAITFLLPINKNLKDAGYYFQ